jgi:MFS family permease
MLDSTGAVVGEFNITERYRYFVVWSLCVVYLFNQADRQIFAVLQQPIKEAFHLSDGQLGLVGGTAFALFYVTLGIPIARRADRSDRVDIISVSLAFWSLFTAVTSLVQGFWQLLIARVFVAVGEAGCNPPSYSIISDYFNAERRATAISIYSLGSSGGSILGLMVGSSIAQAYGWRTALLVMGLPGLILAVIVKRTLREPPRGYSDPTGRPVEPGSFNAVLRRLWGKRTFRNLGFAGALVAIAANGVGGFYSVWLIRAQHLSLAETGRWLTLASILGGLSGTFLGGKLADVLTNRNQDARWLMWVPTSALVLNVPVGLLLFTASGKGLIFALLTFNIALGLSYLAPTVTATQRLSVANERALAAAVFFFVMNLLGLGLGPLIAGHLSDYWREYFLAHGAAAAKASADGIRYALMCMLAAPVIAIVFYMRAARTARDELVD